MTNYYLCIGAISLLFFSRYYAFGLHSNCILLPNIILHGGTYDEMVDVDLTSCCISCTNDPCCMAYTYDEKKRHCFKKSAITDSKRQYFMKSGIKANAYNGQGARLRNIKLKGGKPNIIEFDNLRECESFCHAYGMCTWSAKSEPLKQSDKKGICTCFKQIDHISYCFGTNSSIIPNSPDV